MAFRLHKPGIMRGIFEDLRYAFRVLRGSPGFTVVAVLTLALGIAANATVFGWIDTLLLRPFSGVPDGGRLAAIETVDTGGQYLNTSYRDYRDYRDGLASFNGLAGSLYGPFNVGPVDHPQRVFGEYVSGNYFSVLGVKALRGRFFLPSESGDQPAAFPLAVISYDLWQKLFRGDPAIPGKTIRVNRYQLTVAGVAPESFRGTMPGMHLDIWIPMTMAPTLNGQGNWLLEYRGARQLWLTGRLKPGVTVAQANAEVELYSRRIAKESPRTSEGYRAAAMPIWKAHYGVQALLLRPLRVLMAICVVLFLIVGANVANLQLARATVRRKEMSLRMALGAGPWRVTRQLLIESLLLAALGAVAGISLAACLGGTLVWMLPALGFPVAFDFSLNAHTLGFTILLCCAGAVLTGLAPAMHTVKNDLIDSLKEGGRGGTAGAAQNRTRGLLVIAEVSLALVALVGTALFARSFQNVRAIQPGFDTRSMLFAKYRLDTFCSNREQREQFCLRLRDRLREIPGIAAVSFSNFVPLEIAMDQRELVQVEGYVPRRGEDMNVSLNIVAPAYFDALHVPLLEGRDFTELDDRGTSAVAIVSQAFARRFYGGANPIGRRVRRDGVWMTIVGMAQDFKYHTLTESPVPIVFTPYRQTHDSEFWTAFFIRTAGAPRSEITEVRRAASAINLDAGVAEVVPYQETVEGSLYAQKVAAALLGVLGGVSMLLAALGLYSVLAYAVTQREHEFGIRLALGAAASDVLSLVLRRALALTAAGVVAGTVMAIAAMRMADGLLIGVNPSDPSTIGASAAFLSVIAFLASYVPARRATRVDPMVALREQ